MVTDPISDLINRVKIASDSHQEKVVLSYSNLKMSIAEELKKKGFIADFSKKGKKIKKNLEVILSYEEGSGRPRINGVARISKPSKRIYKRSVEIRPVKYGKGLLILSTPKGIMSGEDAKVAKLGGEALFKIW